MGKRLKSVLLIAALVVFAAGEAAALQGDEGISGSLSVGGNATILGNQSVLGTLAVTGTTTLTGATTQTGAFGAGAGTFTGALTAGSLTTDGAITIPTKFTVSAAGNLEAAGYGRFTAPATQTIAAGDTVTADACGGFKPITAAGAVTTGTTNTFTDPAALSGCCMDVVNVGATHTITLDGNAKFIVATSTTTDVALTAGDTVRVCTNGTAWYAIVSVLSP